MSSKNFLKIKKNDKKKYLYKSSLKIIYLRFFQE